MLRGSLIVCASALALLTIGCGPSVNEVVDEYRPRMQELQAKLQRLAANMPQRVGDQAVTTQLQPRLYKVEGDAQSNTEVRMIEQLTDDRADPKLNLNVLGEWGACFRWLEPDSAPQSANAGSIRQAYEQTVNTRYLVVHRVKDLQAPRAIDDERFTPGAARIEGVVFDLNTEAIVATYTIDAQTSNQVNFAVRDGETRRDGLQRFADSSLWEDARKKTGEKLANMTYGVVQFDRHREKFDVPVPAGLSPAIPAPAQQTPVAARPEQPATPVVNGAASVAGQKPPQPPTIDLATQKYLRDLPPALKEVHEELEHQLMRDFAIRGVEFQHGLYTHPPGPKKPGRVLFSLKNQYRRLTGGAGQSDGLPPRSFSPLTFRILGDGRELWSSPPLTQHGDWSGFDLDVAGVDQLELRVDCPGDHSFAWGAWLDPVLTK
ncbi:MAG TPA: NPCBM/NEW2 domain-containing protein [Pirellulaceae bacterium]|nr:NPCBM/NEW2 domain-containing protein [Pirellulaceae bacterium]